MAWHFFSYYVGYDLPSSLSKLHRINVQASPFCERSPHLKRGGDIKIVHPTPWCKVFSLFTKDICKCLLTIRFSSTPPPSPFSLPSPPPIGCLDRSVQIHQRGWDEYLKIRDTWDMYVSKKFVLKCGLRKKACKLTKLNYLLAWF